VPPEESDLRHVLRALGRSERLPGEVYEPLADEGSVASEILRDEEVEIVSKGHRAAVEGDVVEGAEGEPVRHDVGAAAGVPPDVGGLQAEGGPRQLVASRT
jgi:hypothetical protein